MSPKRKKDDRPQDPDLGREIEGGRQLTGKRRKLTDTELAEAETERARLQERRRKLEEPIRTGKRSPPIGRRRGRPAQVDQKLSGEARPVRTEIHHAANRGHVGDDAAGAKLRGSSSSRGKERFPRPGQTDRPTVGRSASTIPRRCGNQSSDQCRRGRRLEMIQRSKRRPRS